MSTDRLFCGQGEWFRAMIFSDIIRNEYEMSPSLAKRMMAVLRRRPSQRMGCAAAEDVNVTNGPGEVENFGFCGKLLASWWMLPLLHIVFVWVGGAIVCTMDRICPRFGNYMGFLVIAWWVFGLGTALCMPFAVLFQIIMKRWKTALATVLFSAVALTPLVCFLWGLSTFQLH